MVYCESMKLKTIGIIIAIVTIAILAIEVLAYKVKDYDEDRWETEGGIAIIGNLLEGEAEYNSEWGEYLLKESYGSSRRAYTGTCWPESPFYAYVRVEWPDGSVKEELRYTEKDTWYVACTLWHRKIDFKTSSWFYDDYAHQYFELRTWTHLEP